MVLVVDDSWIRNGHRMKGREFWCDDVKFFDKCRFFKDSLTYFFVLGVFLSVGLTC